MTKKFYPFTALTGGGSGAVDALASIDSSGSALQDLDAAIVVTASDFYPYTYDIDSGLAEDSPKIIKGDDEGGNSRFSLVKGVFNGIDSYGNIISSGTASIDGVVGIGGTLTVPNITVSGNVDGRDLSVDGAKLDNVEASADVTDSTNVDAAGAVMGSDYNAQTILVAVSDNSPTAIIIEEQTLIGRLTSGNVATVGIGIADNDIVQIDQAGAADNDYAKFTTNGLEGRSYAETLGDLSGVAATAFSFNDQNITNVGDISCDSLSSDTSSLVTTNCGQGIKRTALGAADYNPSVLTTDYLIAVDNTDAARAVTISTEDEDFGSAANPRVFVIKDESGGAAAHNITISLESGGNIDGAATHVLNQPYQSVTLYLDGTNGFII